VEKEFKLPELGEGIDAGEVVRVLVAPGDEVQAGQTVLELETDKALLEVDCPYTGKVSQVFVKDGEEAKVGTVLLTVATAEEAPTEKLVAPTAPPPEPQVEEPPVRSQPRSEAEWRSEDGTPLRSVPDYKPLAAQPVEGKPEAPLPAGPATRRLARELGVDLRQVTGRERGGRITEEDVKQYVRERMASPPLLTGEGLGVPPASDRWGPVERIPLRSVRKKTAERMSQAWSQIPHVTHFDRADVTELEALRRRHAERAAALGGKLTVTALALRAAVVALKEFPEFNASLEGDEVVLKRYYHLGVAVDTGRGLIVPVIRDVDRKGLFELAHELTELAERARTGKVDVTELQGATFTLTNLGGIGGTNFTPLINPPEVAILGLSRSREEPVVQDGEVKVRLMLPLCVSYDHRVIDGATAARFTRRIVELLEDPERLLLGG